ncbi:hypothetical protein A7K94_0207235 [Modestobacter sp. VKM Ac-2676]|nr:hypothetical protein A7K94_0207235 [Modestobacter sp. VKM Ac-2676]
MTRSTRVPTRNGQPLVSQNDPDRRAGDERDTAAHGDPADVPGEEAGESNAPDARGLFQRHSWLIPATTVLAIIVAFAMMIVLTLVAGGSTPFTG